MMEITDQTFEKEVLQSKIPVLVDFWAPWCVSPKTYISLENNFSSEARNLERGIGVLGWRDGLRKGIISYSRVVADAGHCLMIKTTSGRKIEVTDEHLFYTPNGWKQAQQLGAGQKVAVYPLGEPLEFQAPHQLLVDEREIRKVILPKMKITSYLKELRKLRLLPLYLDDPKILILSRLMGSLFTDGNLYQGKNNLREVSFSLGSKHDAEEVIEDLRSIGFSKAYLNLKESVGDIGGRRFVNKSFRVKVLSSSLWLLMRSLGVPSGSKKNQDYLLRSWLMKGPLGVKKEFLSAFFGGDGPKITISLAKREKKQPYNHLNINDFEFHKNPIFKESGLKLAEQLSNLLEEFGVKTRKIFWEEDQIARKDNTHSIIIHLRFTQDFQNGLSLSQKIGYRYCGYKQLSAMYVGEFLRIIQQKKGKWLILYKEVLSLAKQGFSYKIVSKKLNIPPLLAFRWIKGRDKATSPKHFLKFSPWLKQATENLKDGFVWAEIEEMIPIYMPKVARITVEKTNNFIANGFLVHNCGPCQMAGPVVEKIAKEYEGKILVGKMNVDENPQTASKFGIMSIPTIVLFKDGQEIKREIGFSGKEGLIKLIAKI